MDDCVTKNENRNSIMGASGNPDAMKIASLQERKKQIEEKLDKHNKELKKLCIEEAELTGSLPIEYPFDQGEVAPTFRRRIGTAYQLNQNLLNNLNNEEELSMLEMEMHMLAKMAQAALGLANENTSNKAARKAHMANYERHLERHKSIENKLHDLKISIQHTVYANQQKQKKKPRPEHEDSLSMNLNMSGDPFAKHTHRHSLRSLQYQSTQTQNCVKPNRPTSQRFVYLVPDSVENAQLIQQSQQNAQQVLQAPRQESTPRLYKLSLDGYKQYEERQENLEEALAQGLYRSYPGNQVNSRTLPHSASRRSPQTHSQYEKHSTSPSAAGFSQTMLKHSSPSASTSSATGSMKYFPLAVQGQTQMRQHYYDTRNPLQLQPHQQYEQNVMTSGAGLGGYWKQSEHGEFWCNLSSDSLKDKRFGSLDRRKKRLQKKAPLVGALEVKTSKVVTPSVVIPSVVTPSVSYQDATRTLPTKSQAIAARRLENRQLVRTQSLGSVGAITLDSNCCPSDDSSCGSESLNCGDHLLRKNKQKTWYETSLDGPLPISGSGDSFSMTLTPSNKTHSSTSSIAPEEKYDYSTPSATSIPTTQNTKEIPAESFPSPRGVPEANFELFNNNVPKNCTIVQQAQWKPYHEETKPFEMSDFYKYSTKFKKKAADDGMSSPKSPSSTSTGGPRPYSATHGFRNLPTGMQSSHLNNNRSSDISSNCGDGTPVMSPPLGESIDVNAWYQKHDHPLDNNNATLV